MWTVTPLSQSSPKRTRCSPICEVCRSLTNHLTEFVPSRTVGGANPCSKRTSLPAQRLSGKAQSTKLVDAGRSRVDALWHGDPHQRRFLAEHHGFPLHLRSGHLERRSATLVVLCPAQNIASGNRMS